MKLKTLALFASAALVAASSMASEPLGSWLSNLNQHGDETWQTGKLAGIANGYRVRIEADSSDYEARVLHAATILLQLGENKNVAAYAKKFGFTLDYLGMKVSGSGSAPSAWPKVNDMVDTFVKEGVPVLKDALADLEGIPSDWKGSVKVSKDDFPVDDDVYIDIGDVLYARAGIEAAIGLAYFAQGYDLTVDWKKGKEAIDHFPTVPVTTKAVSAEHPGEWKDALVGGSARFVIAGSKLCVGMEFPDAFSEESALGYFSLTLLNANSEYELYYLREGVNGDGVAPAMLFGKAQDIRNFLMAGMWIPYPDWDDYFWDFDWDDPDWDDYEVRYAEYEDAVANYEVQLASARKNALARLYMPAFEIFMNEEEQTVSVFVDFSGKKNVVKAGALAVDYGAAAVCVLDDDWWDYVGWVEMEVDEQPGVVGKILTEQTKFMAKVRNQSSLSQSKPWMKIALVRALVADAAVQARTDQDMHFVEYDPIDADAIERARKLTEKALASLDAPQEIDILNDIGYDGDFDLTLLPNDGVMQVYLGALFEGKITRDLLPTFLKGADEGPVPVMETLKDATFAGLLPEFTTRTWTGVLKELGREVAHQTVTVKLDPNGGKTSVKSVSFDYDDEEEGCLYPELPVPTKAGGIFAGWATAKTGGAIVREGEFYDAGLFAGAKAPTLYAQWIATYALTVKGEGAYAEWDWSDEQYESLPQEVFDGEAASETDDKGVVNVPAGALVRVYAADSAEDKKGNELVFQKWNVSSSKANLGADFRVGECETTLVMPPEKLTLTATYIYESTCGWLCAEAWADEVNLGWNDDLGEEVVIYPPYDAFEWSPDGGKTWYKSGDSALLKAGAYTVSWRSTDANWVSASATKEKVMVYAGNDSGASLSAFAYVPEVVVDVMTVEGGTCTPSALGGSVTMNPKDGLVPVGKAITLTAKASKDYAFQGWAFAKSWQYGEAFSETAATWKLDGGYASSSGLLSYIDPLDLKVHVVAVFKALLDYSAADIQFARFEGWSSCAEVTYDGSGNASVDIKAVVGCALDDDYALVCGPLASPLTYKLDGKLPDGLKFDAKTGVLSGAPKKVGSTVVKITATDPAKNVKSITVNFIVSQLPKWLVGEFRGVAEGHQFGFSDTAYGDPRQCGILELSVKSDGKVSAKIITCHGAGSVSGTLSWADDTFWFFGGKNGWYCNPIYFNPDGTIDGTINSYDKQSGTIVAQITGMRQDKDLLVDSPFIGKYYTFAFASATASDYDESQVQSGYGYLTIKTDKNGAAKVTGQLPDGEKVSVSALLMPVSANESVSARLYLFASPSSYKKEDWFVMTLNIDPDGGVVSEEGAVWTVPDTYAYKEYYYGITDDYSPVDAGIYGKGALYSEAKALEGYYWTACCEYSDQVRQQYSYKDGGWTYYDDESALVLNDYFFNVVVKGDNKGAISLAEKSPAPWIDDDAWNFWEDKKGDAITDPSQLSISFAKATGIFTGKASAYFDYPKPSSASMPYSGVMIYDGADGYRGYGSAVYTYKYSHYDYYGKVKTDTEKVTLPVSLEPTEAPEVD